MQDKDKSLNTDINKGENDITKSQLNEAYIPDFQFTPPTPPTPPPAIDSSSKNAEGSSAGSSE